MHNEFSARTACPVIDWLLPWGAFPPSENAATIAQPGLGDRHRLPGGKGEWDEPGRSLQGEVGTTHAKAPAAGAAQGTAGPASVRPGQVSPAWKPACTWGVRAAELLQLSVDSEGQGPWGAGVLGWGRCWGRAHKTWPLR